MIFPGSGLFGRGPKWLVAAEMVRTGRLYARGCGAIEPAWLEKIAPSSAATATMAPSGRKNRWT